MSSNGKPSARRSWVTAALVGLMVGLSSGVPAAAQELTPSPEAEPTPTIAAPEDEFGRGAPRSATQGFLAACDAGDHARAAEYVDLRALRKSTRAAEGTRLTRQLCTVIERTLWVNLDLLSPVPEGDVDDGLSAKRELFATIPTEKGAVKLLLERQPRDDGTPIWKVSSGTLAKVPALYDEFGYGPLGDLLPAPFFDIRFLQVQLWQWIGLLVLLALAGAAALVTAAVTLRIARSIVARTRTATDDRLVSVATGPLRLGLFVLFLYAGTFSLALSVRAQAAAATTAKLLAVVVVAWGALRIVDVMARLAEERYAARPHVASAMVPLVRRSGRLFVGTLAVIGVLQNLGLNVSSLLAGLGIGGLAVALAAQKTVEHLFGGITLVTDQPVRVGDLCRFGETIGTVEDIGLRSTRIRTVDRTVISVPNGEFAAMQIENFSRRDRIRLRATLGLRYETTPDQLRYLLVELKKLLLGHPKVHPEPARVRFVGFGAYSLDIEVFAYVRTVDYDEYLAVREDIFLRLMDVVNASGTGFAFPSQTHYESHEGLDAARRQAAEAQVQEWRARNALWLPTVPPDQAAALDNTLDYPPPGSAARGGPAPPRN